MQPDSLERNPKVALILEIPPSKDHLYQALREADITVVSECHAGNLDPVELAGADVILVILDEGLEPHLERVTNLVCGARLPVVFDDCRISRDLSGWERNRWARHLHAKLTGSHDTRPPVPEALIDLEAQNDELIEPEAEFKAGREAEFKAGPKAEFEAESEAAMTKAAPACDAPIWVMCAAIGGPETVRRFLEAMPSGTQAAFMLLQHMSVDFQRALAKRLRRSTLLEVFDAADGDNPRAGCLLIVPLNGRFALDTDGCMHFRAGNEANATAEIDRVLFELTEIYGSQTNAIVFNGYGSDGVAGCARLKRLGGKVFAQDAEDAAVGSTIHALREAGLVDFSGTPERLAQQFIQG